MQGLAPHPMDAHTADSPLRVQYPHSASVSIAAKPVIPSFHRSAAVPIALKRPIRKVSFNDLSSLDHSDSDQKRAPVHSSLPRKSGSFSHSYSLKDAFSNRIPTSPGCSNLSLGSDSDESKVRGGRHFDSDHVSSTDSINNLEQSLSGLPDSSATLSSPCDTLSSSTQSQTTTHGLIPSHTASHTGSHTASHTPSDVQMPPAANQLPDSSGQDQQDQLHESQDQPNSAWDCSQQSIDQQGMPSGDYTALSVVDSGLVAGCNDDRSTRGRKTHGGNLFGQGGLCCRSMTAAYAGGGR